MGDLDQAFDRALIPHVEAGDVPGLVALLHTEGQTQAFVSGERELDGAAMSHDTIFRIASAGKGLGEIMHERIFEPLGMTDTGFFVPSEKIERLAAYYRKNPETGMLEFAEEAIPGGFSAPPTFEAGNGGLVSTVGRLSHISAHACGGRRP